ncbi:MAG: ATP synthase subunit I [Armatimonadota bacterium]
MSAWSQRPPGRIVIFSLLPGIVIAGFFVSFRWYDMALGIIAGALIGLVTLWFLAGSVELVGGPDEERRRKRWYAAASLFKYFIVGAFCYVVFKFTNASAIGMCVGYTVALAGFLFAYLTAIDDFDPKSD